MKEGCLQVKMYKDYEEEYFQIYNIIDRLREECERQYGSLYKASKIYGSHHLNKYLNTGATHLGIKMLVKLCKFLNISLQYAVFGGVNNNYNEQEITFNNFYREYKECYKGNVDHLVYHAYWKKTMPLKYLIRVAKRSRKTIDFLIGG